MAALFHDIGKIAVSERIIQVDKSDEFEDALEKLAIGEVYPWLFKYRLFIVLANAMLLVIFLGMFYALRKRLNAFFYRL